MTYVDVHPPQLVDVLVDDRWLPGMLSAWRRDRGRWSAFVAYHVEVGKQHLAWVTANRVRPARD